VWYFDLLTRLLIILAGLQLGLQASFDVDATASIAGSGSGVVFAVIGVSSLWQLFRAAFGLRSALQGAIHAGDQERR